MVLLSRTSEDRAFFDGLGNRIPRVAMMPSGLADHIANQVASQKDRSAAVSKGGAIPPPSTGKLKRVRTKGRKARQIMSIRMYFLHCIVVALVMIASAKMCGHGTNEFYGVVALCLGEYFCFAYVGGKHE